MNLLRISSRNLLDFTAGFQNGKTPRQDSSGGGDKSLVSNIMTSSQALKRRSGSYDQVTGEEHPSEAIKKFEDPAGDRYIKHESSME